MMRWVYFTIAILILSLLVLEAFGGGSDHEMMTSLGLALISSTCFYLSSKR